MHLIYAESPAAAFKIYGTIRRPPFLLKASRYWQRDARGAQVDTGQQHTHTCDTLAAPISRESQSAEERDACSKNPPVMNDF